MRDPLDMVVTLIEPRTLTEENTPMSLLAAPLAEGVRLVVVKLTAVTDAVE